MVQGLRVRDHSHLPGPFGRPRQYGPDFLDLRRLKRTLLRRLRNEFSLTQDDPALCDGIFAKFHAVSLTGIARGCGPLLQPVTVPDGSFAGVISHFEILRQLQRIRRTGILAQPAEHAPRGVIGEVRQHFSARRIVALPSHHDEIFRASQRAQIAANAQRFAGLRIVIQTRRAAVALRHHRALERVLLGHNFLRILHPEGDGEALDKIDLKQALQEFPHGL